MQSLCTLRNRCRQWSRNTRYQADATPYLGRAYTGRIAPALPGALIRSPRRAASADVAPILATAMSVDKKPQCSICDLTRLPHVTRAKLLTLIPATNCSPNRAFGRE